MLNDIDKHRRLLLVAPSFLGAGVRQPTGSKMESFAFIGDGVLRETKTEIARYRCIDPKNSNRVKVEISPTPIVMFGDISDEDRFVQVTLENIGRWIGYGVIRPLKPLL
jgi:hypothetical protein